MSKAQALRAPLSLSLLVLALLGATLVWTGCGERTAQAPESVTQEPAEPETPQATTQLTTALQPGDKPWTADTSVGQIVAEQPATARIFELMKIDYCCGGERSLAVAAAEEKIDVGVLLGALTAVRAPTTDTAAVRWDKKPLPELVEHLEASHHVFLRRELPRLAKIIATVARVHAEGHPEMAAVKETFNALHEELIPHLEHEEQVVFPAVRKLAASEQDPVLEKALEQMRGEHDRAGAAIHKLRDLLNDYEQPEDACRLFKEMLSGLLALEKDTLTHVHLENSVLLPRCLAKR